MRKMKIIFSIIFAMILAILFSNKVEARNPLDSIPTSTGSTGARYYWMSAAHLEWDDVFCVSKGGRVDPSATPWRLVARANKYFDGTVAWYRYDAKGVTEEWGDAKTSGYHNRKMAAILWETDLGHEAAQQALWEYWNSWVYSSQGNNCGVKTGGGNSGYGNSYYDNCAYNNDYIMNIYYLEPGWSAYSSYQRIIVVERIYKKVSPITPPTISVTVSKTWNDSNNAYYTRPASVYVTLKANGVSKQTVELNNGNGWSYTFTGLASNVTYSVLESAVTGYKASYSGNQTNGFRITNTLETVSVKSTKKWDDDNNRDGKRPSSVNVTLYENGVATSKTATLSSSNQWIYTFSNLPKYKNGNLVAYTVNENAITGYTSNISGSMANGFTITNTHIPEEIEITTKKDWKDAYKQYANFDEIRPDSIMVKLLADGTDTGLRVTLDQSNNWTATFRGTTSNKIYKYKPVGKLITYTAQEIAYTKDGTQYTIGASGIPGYGLGVIGTNDNGYTITNTHTPHYDGYIEIKGTVWLDGAPGKGNALNGVFDKEGDIKDKTLKGIRVRLYDKNGNAIKSTYTDEDGKFTRSDYAETDANGEYTIRVNYDNSYNVYKLYESETTIENTLKTAYVEFEYDGMLYTTVRTSSTGDNTSKAKENENTRLGIDDKYKEVDFNTPILEKEDDDKGRTTLVPKDDTQYYWKWENRKITASTKDVISFKIGEATKTSTESIKYCNGNGKYERTRYNDSTIVDTNKIHTCTNCEGTGHTKDEWKYDVDVIEINNVNLGLFEREQPDVAIFSDLTKVEVEMNNQKYTYLYGVRNNNPATPEGLKVQFQNKNTYTYRRPVNPADIAYIQEEANSNNMSVKVTYEIKVANLSSTLKNKVDKIANYFDKNYTLNTDGWTETTSGGNFKKVTKDNLNIMLEPLSQSAPIELTYTVNAETIKGLLNQEATLNNATEIEKYSTYYGATTIYAEERTGGRTGKPYAGYDFDSHPGDANIKLKTGSDGVERLYSTDTNGNIISVDQLQDDTDIAPSFVLCLAETPKTLAGTIWEDVDANTTDDERLGNGKIDNDEKQVQNVKVELYNLDGSPAKLYNIDRTAQNKDAITYTDSNGYYKLEGVVTGEYYLKFTYGDDTTELQQGATTIDGGETIVNARNYKSTIITDSKIKDVMKNNYGEAGYDEKWHITHTSGYSVAVDNMLDRLDIPDLQYNNFKDGYVEPQNMTAYTKPFKTQIEFEANGQSNIEATQKEKDEKEILGNISGITNVLNSLDFGISERPRENLYSQKTISNIKLTLANGQVLTEGDPRTQELSYVKAMGFGQKINSGAEARATIEKQLLIEIDAELIQGAQLEIDYEVKVTNNNEKDYDYGEASDYSDINGNNYITNKTSKANYYYYGESKGLDEMKAAIQFVDYLNSEVVYNAEKNTDWESKRISDLKDEKGNKLVSAEIEDFITKNNYIVLVSNAEGSHDGKVTLARGDSAKTLKMSVSKLLSNQAKNVYDNGIEIISIDGKTARTIQESQNGKQIEKEYKPGNYIPNVLSENLEQDDDRVKVIITPPTGITNYITTYFITGLVGLLIVIVGIVFIKKKVLTK